MLTTQKTQKKTLEGEGGVVIIVASDKPITEGNLPFIYFVGEKR